MTTQPAFQGRLIPAQAGIGLRPPHFHQVLTEHPEVPWLEVHSENFFCAGGEMHRVLNGVRRDYPLSLHGVGLSLGSSDRLHTEHLVQLKRLADHIEPMLVSEHLCWGAIGDRHLNDLLPLPYTEEALDLMVNRVMTAQEFLGRTILIENVSTYLTFHHSTIPEWEFVTALSRRSGCNILLDVNNLYVNATNHGYSADQYLRALPKTAVTEIHLAGFTPKPGLPVPLLIDSHSRPVADDVWQLYRSALSHFGPVLTLIEWDQDIPSLEVLIAEAAKAEHLLCECRTLAA